MCTERRQHHKVRSPIGRDRNGRLRAHGAHGLVLDVSVRSRLTADSEHFLLESSLSVQEISRTYLRTWNHTIPRRFV